MLKFFVDFENPVLLVFVQWSVVIALLGVLDLLILLTSLAAIKRKFALIHIFDHRVLTHTCIAPNIVILVTYFLCFGLIFKVSKQRACSTNDLFELVDFIPSFK